MKKKVKTYTQDPLINEPGLVRDQFNLHKLIVSATKPGVIFGLDSLDGEIVWKRDLGLRGCLFAVTLNQDTNINRGVVAVVAKCPGETHLVRLDPLTGDVLESDQLLGNVLRVERMASANQDQVHPLLVISEVDGVLTSRVLGEQSPETKAELDSTYYWLLRRDDGLVQGEGVQ